MRAFLSLAGDVLAESWAECWRWRARTLLAVSGVTIGATALTFMVSLQQAQRAYLSAARARSWLAVEVPSRETDLLRRPARLRRDSLDPIDAEAIRKACPLVDRLVAFGWGGGAADCKAGRRSCKAFVYFTDATRAADLQVLDWGRLEWGRMFSPSDITRGNRVILLNHAMGRELFGDAPLNGASVRVKGVRFRVIGVQREGAYGTEDVGSHALIPYKCAQDLSVWDTRFRFFVLPRSGAEAKMIRCIDQVLYKRIGDPGESFVSAQGGLDDAERRIIVFLSLVALLTLMSSGIAVSNKVYVGVLERVDQIALRRALGATKQRIYGTITLESVLLCGLGSALGGGAGWLLASVTVAAANARAHQADSGLPLLPLAVVLALTVSLGVAAGFQAAAVAVQADPAQGLSRKDVV